MFSKKNRNNDDPGGEMSFMDHLEALRMHLIRSAAAILILGLTAFFFKEIIFDGILFAPKNPGFVTYRILCSLSDRFGLDMCIEQIPFSLISTELSAQFTLHMWIAFLSGLILGFPYVCWEMWRFIKPALHDHERRNATGIVFYTSFLFLLGIAFGYFIITPMSVNFLGSYKVSNEVNNMISLDSYISTVSVLTLATGIVFELPIVIYFLSKVGIMTPSFMRKYRKHSVVIILIVSAIITPTPDITGQVMVAIPLYILYEISIFVSAIVAKKRELAS